MQTLLFLHAEQDRSERAHEKLSRQKFSLPTMQTQIYLNQKAFFPQDERASQNAFAEDSEDVPQLWLFLLFAEQVNQALK